MALSFSTIQQLAEPIGIDPCFIWAVASNESANKGFNADGTIIVRFEKHVFIRELKKRKAWSETIEAASKLTGVRWATLNKAIALHHEAALCSASFGMFQIMGFNHGLCGFDSVFDFVQALQRGEEEQLQAFLAFIRHENLIPAMKQHNYAGFAKRYNGRNYKQNNYDVKLKQAVERCQALYSVG